MDITKLLLLGGAAYLGYEYFIAPAAPPVAAAPPTTGGIQPGATPPVAQVTPAASAATTQSLILAKAGNFTAGNVDQWDYYYAQARGIPAPAPEDWGFTPETRGEILTFPEWWAIAQAHGLSGLRHVVPTNRTGLSGVVPTNSLMMKGVGYIPTNRLMVMEME